MTGGPEKNREVFRQEAQELLDELESSLLELETSPGDSELVGRVFRALHTIKGSGAMFGFYDVASFTHELETVFDLVRGGKAVVTRELTGLALRALDQVRAMLDAYSGGRPADKADADDIIASLWRLVTGQADGDWARPAPGQFTAPAAPAPAAHAPDGDEAAYQIHFHPAPGIMATGVNPVSLIRELRGLGECRVTAHTEAIPRLEEMDPEACYTSWDVSLVTRQGIDAVRDVFIFVDGDGAVEVEQAKNAHAPSNPLAVSTIRVPSDRLDRLSDLVGELVTVQARLSQTAASKADPGLILIAEEVERLTEDLRDNTLSIRMLPIGITFTKFKRVVRDLADELGKEVDLVAVGAETELDKTVMERLNDPLMHLIRNSMDHGIEPPDVREAAGKPRSGTVRLSAVHCGANVLVSVYDDGAGMDADAIRSKAVERGLIPPDAGLDEAGIFALVFAPGFSTAGNVTNVSGRGVGLDVVKRCVEALRGTVEVVSRRGLGTTITLKLPLTLAIIDGLLVRIASDYFVMPLSAVEECVELASDGLSGHGGRRLAQVRGDIIPYIPLRERFMVAGEPPDVQQIVITEEEGRRVGFVVDHVIGGHQTVIKRLSRVYRDVPGISGATILGDGTVALILDVPELVRSAVKENEFVSVHG